MLNNEMKTVKVVTFTTGTDAYGQTRKSGNTQRDIKMLIKVYNQTNVSDIRYVDSEFIGLTNDKLISVSNQIWDGTDKYEVLYIVPTRRMNQIFLKKV